MVFLACAKRGVGQGINLFFLLDLPDKKEFFPNPARAMTGSHPGQQDIRRESACNGCGWVQRSCPLPTPLCAEGTEGAGWGADGSHQPLLPRIVRTIAGRPLCCLVFRILSASSNRCYMPLILYYRRTKGIIRFILVRPFVKGAVLHKHLLPQPYHIIKHHSWSSGYPLRVSVVRCEIPLLR